MEYYCEGQVYNFKTILEAGDEATTFRHFKDKLYKIVTIAKDSADLRDIVVYKAEYGDHLVYTRDAKEFFSDVDKEKYPLVKQKKRFEML